MRLWRSFGFLCFMFLPVWLLAVCTVQSFVNASDGFCECQTDNGILFTTGYESFRTYDLANPGSPVLLDSLTYDENPIADFVIAGDRVIGTNQNHVVVLDIANPASLSLAGSFIVNAFNDVTRVHSLAVWQHYVYLGVYVYLNGGAGVPHLLTYDIANLQNPVCIDIQQVDMSPYYLWSHAGNLFYLTNSLLLCRCTLSNPALPVLVDSLLVEDIIPQMAFSGELAYLCCGNAGLKAIDLSGAAMTVLHTYTDKPAWDVQLSGSWLVSHTNYGLRYYSSDNAGNLFYQGDYYDCTSDYVVAGDYTYISQYGCLVTLNHSQPANPVVITDLDCGGYVFAVDGNRLAIAGDANLKVYDVSNFAAPFILEDMFIPEFIVYMYLSGNHLYTNGEKLGPCYWNIADLTNPTYPFFYYSYINFNTAWVEYPFAVFQIYMQNTVIADVTNPLTPVVLSSLPVGMEDATFFVKNGNYLYVSNGDDFYIYNVSNLSQPLQMSHITLPGQYRGLTVNGNLACLTTLEGVQLLDIGNPAQPAIAGAISFGYDIRFYAPVLVDAGRLMIADNTWRRLWVYDIMNPANPQPLLSEPHNCSVSGLTKEGDYLLYTNSCGNVYIRTAASVDIQENQIPSCPLSLSGYPNPFSSEVSLKYHLSQTGETSLAVYNLKGQRVRTLSCGNAKAGDHHLTWAGRDTQGKSCAAGVYLFRLENGGHTAITKCLRIK